MCLLTSCNFCSLPGEDEAGPSTSKNNEEQAESTDKKKKKKKKKKSERKETEYLSDDGEKSDDNVESKMDLGLGKCETHFS